MKLMKTTDCAVRMLLCMAAEKRLMAASELADKIGVDKKYLFTVGMKLRKAGLVDTILGPFGGYSLARPPESITLYDIAAAFGDTVQCSGLHNLTDTVVLIADELYREIEQQADKFFKSRTLVDLLRKVKAGETL